MTDYTIRPSGPGSLTQIAFVTGAATHWQALSDASDVSHVSNTSAAQSVDLYAITVPLELAGAAIAAVTLYYRGMQTGPIAGGFTGAYKRSGDASPQLDTMRNNMGTPGEYSVTITGIGTAEDLAALEIGGKAVGSGSGQAAILYDVWLVVSAEPATTFIPYVDVM